MYADGKSFRVIHRCPSRASKYSILYARFLKKIKLGGKDKQLIFAGESGMNFFGRFRPRFFNRGE
jgi:hypothetical protein